MEKGGASDFLLRKEQVAREDTYYGNGKRGSTRANFESVALAPDLDFRFSP